MYSDPKWVTHSCFLSGLNAMDFGIEPTGAGGRKAFWEIEKISIWFSEVFTR